MIGGINDNLISKLGTAAAGAPKPTAAPTGASFADTLKSSIDEVSRLQQDASKAVEGLTTGKHDDVTGVMTAVDRLSIPFDSRTSRFDSVPMAHADDREEIRYAPQPERPPTGHEPLLARVDGIARRAGAASLLSG